jgi:hypothetical protein
VNSPNLPEMIPLGCSRSVVSFHTDSNPTSLPLIGEGIINFFFKTTSYEVTKLNRNVHLQVLKKYCYFLWCDLNSKMVALASD